MKAPRRWNRGAAETSPVVGTERLMQGQRSAPLDALRDADARLRVTDFYCELGRTGQLWPLTALDIVRKLAVAVRRDLRRAGLEDAA